MKTLWGQVLGVLLARLIQLGVLNFSNLVPLSHVVDLKDEVAYKHLRIFPTPLKKLHWPPGYSS